MFKYYMYVTLAYVVSALLSPVIGVAVIFNYGGRWLFDKLCYPIDYLICKADNSITKIDNFY